jgi:phosphoribosyl 1,2-cyclic phosphate phosphodiesterase
MQLTFLGCGDDYGVPRIGCECPVCRDALLPGSRNCRTGPSVMLRYGPSYAERLVLIDVAPEFRLQATNLGLRQFHALLLTHVHDVHILGLSTLVKAQRDLGSSLAIYAPAQVIDNVRERFAYLWNEKGYRQAMQLQAIEEPLDLWGLQVQPMRVDHGLGGSAFGYLMSLGECRLAYVSDMLRATAEIRQALSDQDVLVLGASHYYEGIEIWRRSVMDITAAQELIREVAPGRTILTHLSHTVEYDEVSDRLAPDVCLAYDGLTVEIQE